MGTALYNNKECTVHYSSEKCVTRLSLENEILLREYTYYEYLKIQMPILVKAKEALIKGISQILGLEY